MPTKATVFNKIGDDAVKEKTRRTWKQWFSILDAFDVTEKGHKPAAKHLLEQYKISHWWSQAIVIRYEWERGLRFIKNQRTVWPKHRLFREN